MNATADLEPAVLRHVLGYFARLADLGDPAPPQRIVEELLECLSVISRARIAYVEVPRARRVPFALCACGHALDRMGRRTFAIRRRPEE